MPDQLRETPSVIPMLSYEDVGRAADWVARAFGFRETGRWADADGRVTHVNMELGDGMVMLGFPGSDYQSPRHHAEVCDLARAWSTTPYVVDGVLVYVNDIEAHFERAQASGVTLPSPLEDNPRVGQRNHRAEDLEGTAGCSLSRTDQGEWALDSRGARRECPQALVGPRQWITLAHQAPRNG